MKPLGGYTILYLHMCLHDHDYVMNFYLFTVILRSTMGPYGRPMIEVAYGEMLVSLYQGCMGVEAREEWLGCRHDVSPMFDILGSTPVWAQCIIFWFSIYITYVYRYCFKNLYVVEKNTSGLWPCLGPIRFGEWFRLPMSFKWKFKNHRRFIEYSFVLYDITHYALLTLCID